MRAGPDDPADGDREPNAQGYLDEQAYPDETQVVIARHGGHDQVQEKEPVPGFQHPQMGHILRMFGVITPDPGEGPKQEGYRRQAEDHGVPNAFFPSPAGSFWR